MPKRYEGIKKSVGGNKTRAAKIFNATRKSGAPTIQEHAAAERRGQSVSTYRKTRSKKK